MESMDSLTSLMTNGIIGTATSAYVSSDDGVLYIQGYNVQEGSFIPTAGGWMYLAVVIDLCSRNVASKPIQARPKIQPSSRASVSSAGRSPG